MATYSFCGIVSDGLGNIASYTSNFDRKIGERVQTIGGWWGTIEKVCANLTEANMIIEVVRKQRQTAEAKARREQKRIDDAYFVSFLLKNIDHQLLRDAGLIR